jgi:hypothetical protein
MKERCNKYNNSNSDSNTILTNALATTSFKIYASAIVVTA